MNKYLKYGLVVAGLGGVGYLTYRAYLKYQEDLEEEISMEEVLEEMEIVEEIERRKERKKNLMEEVDDEVPYSLYEKPKSIFDIPIPEKEGNPVYNHFNDKLSEDEDWSPKVVAAHMDELEPIMEENENLEEVSDLKYDKNSIEAWNQYVDKRMADIDDEPVSRLMVKNTPDIMRKLFSVEFIPENEQDAYIKNHIKQERKWFFGNDSIYSNGASFAELILHFAEYADRAIDGDVINYCDEWINNIGITLGIGEASLGRLVGELNNHIFETPYGYGLFGLDEEQYERVVTSGEKNAIGYMSYQMEFNVYLNDLIDVVDEDELDLDGYDYD